MRPSDQLLLGPPRCPGTVVWWSGGLALVVIFSCEWWSGGLVVWFAQERREAASSRKILYHKIAQERCEAASGRKTLCRKNLISQKLYIKKTLYRKNFISQKLGITSKNNFRVYAWESFSIK